jgi:hypothetical protein
MSKRLGDAPIENHLETVMGALAQGVDEILNGPRSKITGDRYVQNGFILMVFPFEGHEGRCNYVSNARREDIVILLKEQLARFEGQPDIRGHA